MARRNPYINELEMAVYQLGLYTDKQIKRLGLDDVLISEEGKYSFEQPYGYGTLFLKVKGNHIKVIWTMMLIEPEDAIAPVDLEYDEDGEVVLDGAIALLMGGGEDDLEEWDHLSSDDLEFYREEIDRFLVTLENKRNAFRRYISGSRRSNPRRGSSTLTTLGLLGLGAILLSSGKK